MNDPRPIAESTRFWLDLGRDTLALAVTTAGLFLEVVDATVFGVVAVAYMGATVAAPMARGAAAVARDRYSARPSYPPEP